MAKKNQTTPAAVAAPEITPATSPAAVAFPGQRAPSDDVGVQITPEERDALGETGVVSEAVGALGTEQTVISATPEGTPGPERAEVAIVTLPAVGEASTEDGELLGGPRKGGKSTVALVLRDSAYGRCGQVRPFDAALVEGLEQAGLIDSHPAAVKSAGA